MDTRDGIGHTRLVTPADLETIAGWPAGLPRGEIQIWWARLDDLDDRQDRFGFLLAADESERAARFHFDRDRRRSVAGRALLRLLIGRCLGSDPGRLRLVAGPSGKPELPASDNPASLGFNASGSGGVAAYAFATGREVGIDLEQHRPLPDADRVAARFFSPREYQALQAVPSPQRPAAFFAVWTRKEAYVKATGDGLSRPFGEFSVSALPGNPPALIEDRRDPSAPRRWALRDVSLLPEFSAALCVEAPIGRVVVGQVIP